MVRMNIWLTVILRSIKSFCISKRFVMYATIQSATINVGYTFGCSRSNVPPVLPNQCWSAWCRQAYGLHWMVGNGEGIDEGVVSAVIWKWNFWLSGLLFWNGMFYGIISTFKCANFFFSENHCSFQSIMKLKNLELSLRIRLIRHLACHTLKSIISFGMDSSGVILVRNTV